MDASWNTSLQHDGQLKKHWDCKEGPRHGKHILQLIPLPVKRAVLLHQSSCLLVHVYSCITRLLPGEWLRRDPYGAHVARASIPSLLPGLNVTMVHKVAMQPELQLQRQVQRRQRAPGQILGIKNHNVVAQHIQVVQQRNQVALALAAVVLGDKRRLLEGGGRSGEPDIFGAWGQRMVEIPRVVAEAVEEPARRRSTGGKIVRPCRVDLGLPEMLVLFGDPAVVDAAELAVGGPDKGRCDPRVGSGLGVEDPARGRRAQLVSCCHVVSGLGWIWRPPKEDVAIGDSEVDDDMASVVFVAARNVAVETCRACIVSFVKSIANTTCEAHDNYHCPLGTRLCLRACLLASAPDRTIGLHPDPKQTFLLPFSFCRG